MNSNVPFIVVWTEEIDDPAYGTQHVDYYQTYDVIEDAEARYREMIARRNTHSAHIVLPIQSTDHKTITLWA